MHKIAKIIMAVMVSTVLINGFCPVKTVYGAETPSLESIEEIVNPDCGFYKSESGYLKRNSESAIVDEGTIASASKEYGLVHIRVGLEDFSTNAGGVDSEITENAKTALKNTLDYLKKYKISGIIRFSYNLSGKKDGNGDYLVNEPSFDLIKKHIAVLGSVISEYKEVILSVDSGMFGPWGEQHSTPISSSSADNADSYYQLVESWLNALDESISVTVRRPIYVMYWLNGKYSKNLTVSDLADFNSEDYPESKRVGVYNDGYLGSSSDYGTFKKRDIEVAFIGKLAETVLYGGEVIADSKNDGIGKYNTVDFLEQEGFITHTSYLNIDWDYDAVISKWQEETYDGADPLYNGQTTDFIYAKNHLGYRLILKESSLTEKASYGNGDKLNLTLSIENVGFANMVRKPVANLVLVGEKTTYSLTFDLDLTSVKSKGSKDFEVSLDLPEGVEGGAYKAYLQCQTPYGRDIKFANVGGYEDSEYLYISETNIEVPVVEKKFLVTFDGYYGTLVSGLSSQVVKQGESAVPPVFEREGYVFVGWDKDFTNVNENMTVVAIWEEQKEIVPPTDESESIPKTEESESIPQTGASDGANNANGGGNGCMGRIGDYTSVSLFAVAIFLIKRRLARAK